MESKINNKLIHLTTNFCYLSDAVKIKVGKKNVHDKLVKKVNAIDTCELVKKPDDDAKINEIKDEIPSIAALTTTTAFNVVETKIADVSNAVSNTDYDARIKRIESKCFTTSNYNKSTN